MVESKATFTTLIVQAGMDNVEEAQLQIRRDTKTRQLNETLSLDRLSLMSRSLEEKLREFSLYLFA